MSELIIACGDENVRFQNLDECASTINYSAKTGTKITFGTDQPANLEGTEQLGLVIWLDRKLVAEAIAKAKATNPKAGAPEHG